MRGRWLWPAVALGILAAVTLGFYGCARVVDRSIEQAMVPDIEASTSPALLAEATEYGGWILPANSKVLLVERKNDRDRRYRIAVELSPADLVWMLEQSRFPVTFAKEYPPFLQQPIAGPSLESSPNVVRAQEWFTSPAGTVMMRDITVDERDANTRIVHIDFRGV
ncbi:hypothetical protein [Nocardia carnea]|uniref:hypothetical protein n=1 Tax=Nocardia carnea TaxID=37328 RepID=UPI0024538027|nr:hypothetical protein [Nocardia carnea]